MASIPDQIAETGRLAMTLNWGGEGYNDYQGYMKISGAEKQAQEQTVQESNFLQQMMQTQFAEQQQLLNSFLIPQLKQMATDPQGFGAKALANMQSQLINTVGSQYASQTQAIQNRFATQNMAGLGSGFQTALQANLAQGAAGQEAGGLLNIGLANEQAKLQQQQFGLSGLMGAEQELGAAPQSAGLAIQSNQNRFGQSYQMAKQGSLWQNLLGGVVGAGLNMIAPGVGSLVGGAISGAGGGGGGFTLPSGALGDLGGYSGP